MYRYLALVWNPQHLESMCAAGSLIETAVPAAWTSVYNGSGIRLFRTDARQSSATMYPLERGAGVIFGRIFEGDCNVQIPRAASFGEAETRKVLASGGRHVLERYWGTYIAIIYDESTRRHHVFRDPTGTMPCYHTTHRNIEVFFSAIEDAVECIPDPFSIDREYLARWLYRRNLANGSTGLDNVKPLPPAECLTIAESSRSRTRLWNPVTIASTPAFEQPEEAASALRTTVQNTVHAWASCYEDITHRLSGGLDSSIVAACLAQAPSKPRLTYLNIAIESAGTRQSVYMPGVDKAISEKVRAILSHGDERRFARLVAKRWNGTLVERKRNPNLDMQRLIQVPLKPGPLLYFTDVDMDEARLQMISDFGTQAFFSGQAGDSVFFATTQPMAAIDYAYIHGARPALWRHLLATATLSRESLWSVLGKSVAHGLLRRRYISLTHLIERPGLLTQELTMRMPQLERDHRDRQYAATSSLPPGKQMLAQAVGATPYFDCEGHSGYLADHIDPLDAQPVWELMLRIPTYTVLKDGVSRGLARHAFRDVLPEEIRKRVAKGSGSPFYQNIVRYHRGLLREYLLDGELVKDRYLDRRKVDECLAADDPSMTIFAPTLLSYLSAEIWLRQWREVRTAGAGSSFAAQKA